MNNINIYKNNGERIFPKLRSLKINLISNIPQQNLIF